MLLAFLIGTCCYAHTCCYAQGESNPPLIDPTPLGADVQASESIFPDEGFIQPPGASNVGNEMGPPNKMPEDFRFLHKVDIDGAWIAGGSSSGFAMIESNASATVIVPIIRAGSPFIVVPSFGVTSLDTPTTLDLPDQVYRTSANILWMPKYSDRLSFVLSVAPGVSSDFVASDQAFRLFGFGVGTYQWSETVGLTFGAVYTGRTDIPVFPAAGVTWIPHEDLRVELTAPRPRIARRVHRLPFARATTEDWFYLAGEMGGSTWAVRRPSGRDDLLTIRDFRAVLGFERKVEDGLNGKLEIGYVFWREIEFENDPATLQPTDTLMIRTGLTF